ncbi:MAG: methionyl-tRNA formyltransferase [Lachnospirales bacterium]
MKVLFMGTPDFACYALEKILNTEFCQVVGVICQPDKPKGRGKRVQYCDVKELALNHDLNIFQPRRIKSDEGVEYIKKMNPDLIVVVAYGQILSKEILDIPKYGCINVHGSLLPKYRGAAPVHRAVINGDTITGATIMYMDEGLDTGDMILKKEVEILLNNTSGDVYTQVAKAGADALGQVLINIKNNTVTREKQNDDLSTYARLLTKDEGNIDWDESSEDIRNKVRGLNPWPTSYSYLNGEVYKIWEVEIYKDYEGKPGQVVEVIKDRGIVVKTGDSSVIVTRIQKQGKKQMETKEFLKGYNIERGASFGSLE